MHTPSTPEVKQPLSATDPRFSTSGILNAKIKEQNRQGLLSTYGGRTGKVMDINKFAYNKMNMRDPSAIPVLEKLAEYYSKSKGLSQARGVTAYATNDSSENIDKYNASVDAINNYLKSYGVKDSGLIKASSSHNYDKRYLHDDDYAAANASAVSSSNANVGTSGDIFNEVEKNIKKQKSSNPTTK